MIIISAISLAGKKAKKSNKGHLEIHKLNDHFQQMKDSFHHILMNKDQLKKLHKEEKKAKKEKSNDDTEVKPNVFVIDFQGDIKASAVTSLREEVTGILGVATQHDEVIVRLESAGGLVHAYGLAASQLCRIRSKGIKLTITVDKVAASGGYMMACTADKILAAPFAVVGSIGVMAQLPNFNKVLKKNDVEFELHTAGEFKRTLTVFGENTETGREKFKQDIEDTHGLFKQFIRGNRDQVDIEKVATGEIWYGQQAVDMKLVDELMTSDEYICQRSEHANIIRVAYIIKKNITEKFGMAAHSVIDTTLIKWWERLTTGRFFS